MRVVPLTRYDTHGSVQEEKINNKKHHPTSEDNDHSIRTGRGFCLDLFCSIQTLLILFVISSLFTTCITIWIILMVMASQDMTITMAIASLVVWCTFVLAVIVFSVVALVFMYYVIRRPLREHTQQLSTMKLLRFDSVRRLESIFYEFIPMFKALSDMNALLQEIRPFIPESITRSNEDELPEPMKEEQLDKEIQAISLRKSITAASKSSRMLNTSSVANLNGNNPLKTANSVFKLKRAMSKARKSVEGHGSDGGSFMSKESATAATVSAKTPEVAHITTNLGLGLNSHITTIIIIQFRNFDGKSYPNTSDLVSVFTLLFQKVQSASRQFKGRCSIITPKVLMVSFEVGKNVERNALLCALQLEKQMQAINTQLCEQVNLPSIQFGIGVSRSECLVGNIGTAAVRFSALIGACSSNALRLAGLCAYLGTSILTDESLTLALQRGFLTRAVHFIQKTCILEGEVTLSLEEREESCNKQSIFQLLGESKVNDDEWFYEIQQQENNNKYKEFDKAFDLLRAGDVDINGLGEICEVFGSYSSKYPDDRAVTLLYTQLTELLKLDPKDVEKAVRTFSLENTNVPLHTDPSFIL